MIKLLRSLIAEYFIAWAFNIMPYGDAKAEYGLFIIGWAKRRLSERQGYKKAAFAKAGEDLKAFAPVYIENGLAYNVKTESENNQ